MKRKAMCGLSGEGGMELFVEQEATSSSMGALGDKEMPIQWTNEKHSLYLKSMEASFVEQLYNSIELLGGRWQEGQDSTAARSSKNDAYRMTDQFKVHRNGSWKRFNFGKGELLREVNDEHRLLLSNPWIRHFTSRRRKGMVLMTPREGIASGRHQWNYRMKQLSQGSHNECSTYCNEEGSDQNFINEVEEEEADDSAYRRKKLKTL
ncbi:Cold-regulated protein 27-like protein [Drosera capensis]